MQVEINAIIKRYNWKYDWKGQDVVGDNAWKTGVGDCFEELWSSLLLQLGGRQPKIST